MTIPLSLIPSSLSAIINTMTRTNSFKLVLLGESAVGKSSLVLRFVSVSALPDRAYG